LRHDQFELMVHAADQDVSILPPMPALYHHPQSIMDLMRQSVGRALRQVGIEHNLFRRWGGRPSREPASEKQAFTRRAAE
jgi:4-hydroxy-3-polyprenylbenzoate decarboxylase